MGKTRFVSRWTLLGLVVLLTLVAGAFGIAYAAGAIPAADGTINACYNDQHVRLVEDADSCKKKETAISWNQQGADGNDGAPADPIRTIAREDGFNETGVPSALDIVGGSKVPTLLTNRVLEDFTKTEDATGIRVSYTDNRGCSGNNVACQWEIRFDNDRCTPNLTYMYYSDHNGVGGILKFPRRPANCCGDLL